MILWCNGSMIIPDAALNMGGSSRPSLPDDVYSEIMAVIGDLSAAGFEGKSLAEVIIELRKSISDTATDKEVKDMLDSTFGAGSSLPVDPGAECPDNTATDQEVEDVLNDVFGK